MLRNELSSKLWSVVSSRWSVFVGYSEPINTDARLYGCRRFIRALTHFTVRRERFSHAVARRHLGSSSEQDSAVGNVAAERTELQRLAEEKRLLLQKKKEAKRAERIDKQRQRLEKKVTMSCDYATSAVGLPTS